MSNVTMPRAGTAVWAVDGDGGSMPLASVPKHREESLVNHLQRNAEFLRAPLLLIGRGVVVGAESTISLLALDKMGVVHVGAVEEGDATAETIARIQDQGVVVETFDESDIRRIFAGYQPGTSLEDAFLAHFGTELPSDLNWTQILQIVAAGLDSEAEHMVRALEDTEAPVEVIAFREFVGADADTSYILIDRWGTNDGQWFEHDDEDEYFDESSYTFLVDEDADAEYDEDEEVDSVFGSADTIVTDAA